MVDTVDQYPPASWLFSLIALTSFGGLMLNATRHRRSRAQYYNVGHFQRRVVLCFADYVVSGALVYTLIMSYAMHVRALKSWLVGSSNAPSALVLCRLAVDGAVAMCSAGALRTTIPDFIHRGGMCRAEVRRSYMMAGKWWTIAVGALSCCAAVHLWFRCATAHVSTEVHWIVASVLQYTLSTMASTLVRAGQTQCAATTLQRAVRLRTAARERVARTLTWLSH